jgi:periplasmic protein TonB
MKWISCFLFINNLNIPNFLGGSMYLYFNSQGKTLPAQELAPLCGSGVLGLPESKAKSFFAYLSGEEQPNRMLGLLFTLVLLLHLLLIMGRQTPEETAITPAKQLMMEVSMIAMPAQKPSVAPAPLASQQTAKRPEPIKPQVKPLSKKLPQEVKKVPVAVPAEKSVEPQPLAEVSNPTPAANSAPTELSANSHSIAPVSNQSEQFIEANFRANYASNPKPEYPAIAKSRDWQGKVMLHVQVSADGLSDSVRVEKSSGYEMLDECAMEAVKRWRFIPAKRGETAVASSVLVPITFSLAD